MNNLYIRIINEVINYIEENIAEQLTLQSVSERFYLSEFHFSRIFNTLVGTSIKQYILGRKLSIAAKKLKDTKNTVTDIALEIGFEYPEVFSRNFKKWFGITPSVYREERRDIAPMQKALVAQRNIANFRGVLTLKESYRYLNGQNLCGIFIEVDENSADFHNKLKSSGENFLTDKRFYGRIKEETFYTVVNCFGDDSGRYSVFYGGESVNDNADSQLNLRNIPGGCYACFDYYGEMPYILEIWNRDFYKWLIVKEIEPSPNGIGMLTIYDRRDMKNIQILIPVKQPK